VPTVLQRAYDLNLSQQLKRLASDWKARIRFPPGTSLLLPHGLWDRFSLYQPEVVELAEDSMYLVMELGMLKATPSGLYIFTAWYFIKHEQSL
jgi:hypothetical protein